MRPCLTLLSLGSVTLCLLSGCALQDNAGPALDVKPAGVHGTVYGGQQPVTNATVTVYAVGSSGYGAGATSMASATTSSIGAFSFASTAYTCPAANTPMYLVVTYKATVPETSPANPNLALIAVLGNCSVAKNETVNINEVTTAATVVALKQFMSPTLGYNVTPTIGGTCYSSGTTVCAAGTYNQGLVRAMNYTYPMLVDNTTGQAVASSTSGSMTITTEATKLNTIANVLAACVNSGGAANTLDVTSLCGQLFNDTNVNGAGPSLRPYDTVQAALMMALYPWYNVSTLYGLIAGTAAPFVSLSTAPNDWTVAISYATSALGASVAGGSNYRTSLGLDIDASGNIWFPSSISGGAGVGYFSPSSNTFNGPYNSTASPIANPQYVAIDTSGIAWASDASSNVAIGVSTTSPSSTPLVVTFSNLTKLGPIAFDISNSLLITGSTSNTTTMDADSASHPPVISSPDIVVDYGSLPVVTSFLYDNNGLIFNLAIPGGTCGIFLGNFTYPQVSTSSSSVPCYSGGAANSSISTGYAFTVATASIGQICDDRTATCRSPAVGLNNPVGIATDGNNNLWIANAGNSSISTLHGLGSSSQFSATSTVPYVHDATHGGTLTTPYALGIDGSGNVWTLSPGCVTTSSTACTPTGMVLSELVGAAAPVLTPLATLTDTQINTTGTSWLPTK